MKATPEGVRALIDRIDTNDAIESDGWAITRKKDRVLACNAYNIIDRFGIYDSFRPFCIEWEDGAELLSFDVTFDGGLNNDRALSGLRAYIQGLVIEAVLEGELDNDLGRAIDDLVGPEDDD